MGSGGKYIEIAVTKAEDNVKLVGGSYLLPVPVAGESTLVIGWPSRVA